MQDAKLQILLTAQNESRQAFNDFKKELKGVQQELIRATQTAEGSFNLDKIKAGLLGAAGAIYGAYQTIGKAIEMAAVGSKLEKQAAAFQNLSASAGTSSERMLESLKRVSEGMVAEADLIGSAGKAMLMGINPAEITKLMEIAAATSKSTGQTITEAFNDITMGVARQSKMILDNLGIIVHVDKAQQDYARTLGKTATALTDTEKRQAFMNSVIKSGEDMIKRIGASAGSLDNVNKLIAAQSDLWNEVSKTVAAFLDDELGGYVKVLNWIDEKLKGMRQAKGEITKSDLWKEIEMLRSLEAKGMAAPGLAAAKEAEYNRRYLQPQFGLKASEELKKRGTQTPAWAGMASWREREGNYADYTEAELKAMAEARDKIINASRENAAKIKKAQDDIWKDYKPRYSESQQSEAMLADQKAWEEYKKRWDGFDQRLPESQQSESMLADQARWEEWKKESENSMNYLVELSERTAERMQDNFSDLFFDAFRGELKSFEDYVSAVFTSIQRMAADMAGQLATQAIFGGGAVGGTAGGGGLISWLSGLLGGGSMSQSTALALVKHSGGMVDGSGPARAVPAWMISNAPRLHNGLAPDEFPAILQRGETVIPRAGAVRERPMEIHVHMGGGDNNLTRQSLNQLQAAIGSSISRAVRRNA